MMSKILIVEDDVAINNLLSKILTNHNYAITQAFSGTEAQLRLEMDTFDLILLDLMLPGINGEQLIEMIRTNSQVPIIVLSAKGDLIDRVNVLNLGADDYLTKPFEKEEVLARINVCLRRYKNYHSQKNQESDTYTYKNLTLNTTSRDVQIHHHPLILTGYEYEILLLLIKNKQRVYSREAIYETVWNREYYGEDNAVNVHVSNLRKKITEYDPEQEYIKTVWGVGFKMA